MTKLTNEETAQIIKSQKVWVDPPSGWKFGFPKIYDKSVDNPDMNAWMIEQGYPKKVMESCGNYFYVRMWEATSGEM